MYLYSHVYLYFYLIMYNCCDCPRSELVCNESRNWVCIWIVPSLTAATSALAKMEFQFTDTSKYLCYRLLRASGKSGKSWSHECWTVKSLNWTLLLWSGSHSNSLFMMIMRVLLQNYVLSGIHRPWIRLGTFLCASECQYKKVVMAAICLCSPPTMQYLYSFWLLQSGERESCNMFILLVLNEPSRPPPGLQLQRLANKCMRSDLIRYKPVPVLLGSKISFLPPTTPIRL